MPEPIKVLTTVAEEQNTLPLLFDTDDNVGYYKCLFSFSRSRRPTPSLTITLSYTTFNKNSSKLGEAMRKSRLSIDSGQASMDYTEAFYKATQQEDAAFRKLFHTHGLINYPADAIPAITMEMFTNAILDFGKGEPIW